MSSTRGAGHTGGAAGSSWAGGGGWRGRQTSWPTPGRHALHTTIGHSRDDSARVHVEEYMVGHYMCVCVCVCVWGGGGGGGGGGVCPVY